MALRLSQMVFIKVARMRSITGLQSDGAVEASAACVKQKPDAILVSPLQRQEEARASQDPATIMECLSRKLFEDPTRWWDERRNKRNSKVPDCKKAETGEGRWIDNLPTPVWVHAKLNSLQEGKAGHIRACWASGLASYNIKARADFLWQNYFQNPNDWWDNRNDKLHPKSPDFRHKSSNSALWIGHWNTPKWVTEALKWKPVSLQVGRGGFESDTTFVGECGHGNAVHLKLSERNEYFWTALISQHTKCGQGREAVRIYGEMRKMGVEPNSHTFVAVLKACSILEDLDTAKRVHADLVRSGLESDIYVATMLVDAYAKCRSLVDARIAFEKMPHRDVVSWNSMILGYVQMDKSDEALQLYTRMQQEGVVPHDRTFVSALKACSSIAESGERNESDSRAVKEKCLGTVKTIHSDIVKGKLGSSVFVGTMLVDAYAKCGSLEDARQVFEKMPLRDVVAWNSIISGYAHMDKGEEALQFYTRMEQECMVPDGRTYVSALKACSSLAQLGERKGDDGKAEKERCLETVRAIHKDIVRRMFDSDVFVGTMLVDVYAKCGSLEDARHVFEKMPSRTVVSWNAMLSGYTQMNEGEEALELYSRMQQEGVAPNSRTYVSVLKACSTMAEFNKDSDQTSVKERCLDTVRAIHRIIAQQKFELDAFMGTMLVDVYAKCGSLDDARSVFDRMLEHSVVSWNAIILGYANMDEGEEALQLYTRMQLEGVVPNDRTYVGALKACSTLSESGERIEGKNIDVKERRLENVRAIHRDIVKHKFESDMFVGTMLVDVYAKCGSLEDARDVFEKMIDRTVVSWNAMILGCAQMEKGEEALQLYARMLQEGVIPHARTYVSVLKACSSIAESAERNDSECTNVRQWCLKAVRSIHIDIVKRNFEADVFVGNMLLDAYGKCGSLEDVRQVFEKMPRHDVVSWNGMILGCAQMNKGEEALQLYTRMQIEGALPDSRTYVSALKACCSLVEMEQGNGGDIIAVKQRCLETVKSIHTDILKAELELDVFVGTMLVDVYAKCGSLQDARHVFDKMPVRTVVSWNAMIVGYTQRGGAEEALHLFSQMQGEGVVPNDRTYTSALKACSALAELKPNDRTYASARNGWSCPPELQDRKEVDRKALKERCLETVRAIHASAVEATFQSDLFVETMLVDVYAHCGSLEDARHVFEKMRHRDVVAWTAMISGYAQMDNCEEALQFYTQMQQEGVIPDSRTYVSALKACSKIADLGKTNEGEGLAVKERCLKTVRSIHVDIVKQNFELDLFVGPMLVDVYVKCGCLEEARHVFENMHDRTVGLWNAMILGYAQMNKGEEALQLYMQMQEEGVVSDFRTFVSALKACSSLAEQERRIEGSGIPVKETHLEIIRSIHSDIVKQKFDSDMSVGTMLVEIYTKCGSLEDARCVFEKMFDRTVVSWNAMILGYVQLNQAEEGLQLFGRMQGEGIVPNGRTYVNVLRACSSVVELERNEGDVEALRQRCLKTVRAIHSEVVKTKTESDVFLETMLVDVYAKCGSLEDARRMFEVMPHRDVVSWTTLISGYAQMEKSEEALQLYTRMQQDGIEPDGRTFVSALKACSSMATSGERKEGEGIAVDERCLEAVQSIHRDIVRKQFESDVFVGTMLVDVYAKCGSLGNAESVFEKMPERTVVSWNAMILGYAQMDKAEKALQLYVRMQQEGVVPDDRTYVSALKACSSLLNSGERNEGETSAARERCLVTVRCIHRNIVDQKLELDLFVGTMLVDVFAKCGSLEDARHVFDSMPRRDVVSWNSMILGYVEMDKGEDALQVYTYMQREGVLPNEQTYVGALNACGSVAGLEKGKDIHAQIVKAGLEATDSFVTGSLINMYGKCGSMVDAQKVFEAMPTREVGSWNALIGGYAHQGESELVFDLFHRMKQQGVHPDGITFLGILTVCSHVGLLDVGQKYLKVMTDDYGIAPTIKHFTCIVDLLGRSGQLLKAMEIVKKMPFQPDTAVWASVLGSCRKWGDVELGRRAFECSLRVNKNDAAAYVMMANIFAAARMWEEAKEIQTMRLKSQAWKQPGRSRWTDESGTAHVFVVGDQGHPESQNIYAKLGDLLVEMKKQGYIPHLDSVLRDIPDDEKEEALCGHSERLAIAYALLKTPQGTTIRVVKNLRVCEDCHRATALISKIEQRTIICRDASRFHVFKDGSCSCGDYW